MTERRLILVLGMHRSGTSATARALQCFGASLGENLLPANGSNRKGFFEDLDLVYLNTAFQRSFGFDWDTASEVNSGRHGLFTEALRSLIIGKLSNAPLLALKDPRLCVMLPLLREALTDIDVSCVIAVRHPAAVAESLKVRDGFDINHGLRLWQEHNRPLFRSLDPAWRRVVVCYDNLLDYPARELNRIGTALDLECDLSTVAEYKFWLDRELKHHEPANHADLPDEIAELWSEMVSRAET